MIWFEALPSTLSVFPNEFNLINSITDFIKLVGEKDMMRGFAEYLIGFPQRV